MCFCSSRPDWDISLPELNVLKQIGTSCLFVNQKVGLNIENMLMDCILAWCILSCKYEQVYSPESRTLSISALHISAVLCITSAFLIMTQSK